MKKIYILFAMVGSVTLTLSGQEIPCPPTGVTTNPDAPSNTIEPQTLHQMHQNVFDWRDLNFDARLGPTSPMIPIVNPNYDPNGATSHLGLQGDYQPEDGWELLYVDLGVDRNGNWNTQSSGGDLYIIFYNKYRAIIRVFMAVVAAGENSLVEMQLSMNSSNATALLASIDKVQQPLRYFDASNIASNVQVFSNNNQFDPAPNWFYADFPVNYDPCTCENYDLGTPSTFSFKAELQSVGKIELNGVSIGSLKIDKQAGSPAQSNWDKFYGTTKKAGNFIKAGRKGYKDFGVFKSDVKKSADGKSKKTEMESGIDNLGSFLTDNIPALKLVPYASEALALIDFFVGGGKKEGQQEVTFPPMSIQLEHSFTGSMTFASNYIDRLIYTPGSSFTPQNSTTQGDPLPNGDPLYPIYNETLGVYTLLEKPKVEIYGGFVTQKFGAASTSGGANRCITRKAFIIDKESIKIALNPASGLTVVETYLQLNVALNVTSTAGIISSSGGAVINDTLWVSSMIPLGCAASNPVILDEEMFGVGLSPISLFSEIGDLSISTILVLKNSKGDRFIHKGTWATDYSKSDYPYLSDLSTSIGPHVTQRYNWFNKPLFMNYNKRFLDATENDLMLINSTISKDTSGLESITVQNCNIEALIQTPLNNGYTNLLAGQTIEILPNSEVLPKSVLQVGQLGINCNTTFDLAADEFISTVCESSEYQQQRTLTKKEMGMEPNPLLKRANLDFTTYPNPAQEVIFIALESGYTYPDQLEVFLRDVAGLPVRQTTLDKNTGRANTYKLSLAGLAAGIYMLTVETGNTAGQRKIVVL